MNFLNYFTSIKVEKTKSQILKDLSKLNSESLIENELNTLLSFYLDKKILIKTENNKYISSLNCSFNEQFNRTDCIIVKPLNNILNV